jgi:putative flippase GtrA
MKIDRTLPRFIFVGVINTIVGTSIMFALYNLAGCSYWLSSAANYFFTSILSFFLNKYFTFGVKQWSPYMIITFGLTIAISYLLAYSIAKPMVYALLGTHSQRFRDNAAMLTGMCLFTGLNYIGQRFVAFRRKEK